MRLVGIQSKALWWDEGISVFLANLSLPEYWEIRWMDIHPPLYRLLMHGFVRAAGSSDFAVRFLSAALGLVAVTLAFQLGRRALGRSGGLLAGALAGLSPFVLYHSQEAKMYALLLVLSAASLVAAERLLAGGSRPAWWAAGIVTSALALWTHYYAATTVLAVNLTYLALWLRRAKGLPSLGTWTAAQAATIALVLPWVVLEGGRIPGDADRTIGAATVVPGAFAADIWMTLVSGYALLGTGLAVVLGGVFLALALFGLSSNWGSDRHRLLLATALVVPIVVGVLVSIRFPYNAPRFFIVSAVPFAVLIAAGCEALASRRRAIGLAAAAGAVFVTGAGAAAVYGQGSLTDDYRPLLRELAAEGRPDDLILSGYPWHVGYVQAYAPGFDRIVFPIPEQFETYATAADRIWVLYFKTPEGDGDYIRARFEARSLRRVLVASSGESRIALFARSGGA